MNTKPPGTWVRLAARCYQNERVLSVSADAELLFVRALQFAGMGQTDGRVPAAALGMLSGKFVGSAEAAVAGLVDAGLWATAPSGWVIVNWERWQDTAEQREQAKERQRKRKALSRKFSDNTGDTSVTAAPGSHSASGAGAGAGAGTYVPMPPAPRPSGPERPSVEIDEPSTPRAALDDPEAEPVPLPPDLAARFGRVARLVERNGQGQ